MLRIVRIRENTRTVEEIDAATLDTLAPGIDWIWLDATGAPHDDIRAIGRLLGLDPHSVNEVLSQTEYPKVTDHGDYTFVISHTAGIAEDRLVSVELDMFLGSAVLVTFHRHPVPGVDWAFERLDEDLATARPEDLLAAVLEIGAQRYLSLVDALDHEIEQLEDAAISGDPGVLGRVQAMRRDAIILRRVLAPERDMMRALSRTDERMEHRNRRRLESLTDDYSRIVESLDAARALFAVVLDTYRATVAERMNEVMKVLTVFAAIVLPLSLMAGIYGMNFENIPELGWDWSYFALLGLMAATGIGLWVYFARRGFVGGPKIPRVDRTIGRGLADSCM